MTGVGQEGSQLPMPSARCLVETAVRLTYVDTNVTCVGTQCLNRVIPGGRRMLLSKLRSNQQLNLVTNLHLVRDVTNIVQAPGLKWDTVGRAVAVSIHFGIARCQHGFLWI